ncbi:hypothetical protein BHM03_00037076 [Ensete ventricosum]|nr:hypothetical protein BHM03_00037076 [Ensete ventricosum]
MEQMPQMLYLNFNNATLPVFHAPLRGVAASSVPVTLSVTFLLGWAPFSLTHNEPREATRSRRRGPAQGLVTEGRNKWSESSGFNGGAPFVACAKRSTFPSLPLETLFSDLSHDSNHAGYAYLRTRFLIGCKPWDPADGTSIHERFNKVT